MVVITGVWVDENLALMLHGPDVADLVDGNGTSEAEISIGTPEVLNGSAITDSEPYIERLFMTRQVEPIGTIAD
ncbi:hypothetical protein Tco_0816005 [Tanacetum coccineum]